MSKVYNHLDSLLKLIILFLLGGTLYYYIEVSFRGYSHISMLIAGGLCFVLMGMLSRSSLKLPLIKQMLISSFLITGVELVTGFIVNIWMNLNIWDYQHLPLNFMGQICLPFSILWFLLAGPAIILYNRIRVSFFYEQTPKFKLF